MNIGLANLFSYRPHVEHLYYLSLLLKQAGHNVFFLTCDASVSTCYTLAIRGTSKLQECAKCILGGIRSYSVGPVTSISADSVGLDPATLDRLALSSSCTLNRTESDWEMNDPEVVAVRKSLYDPIATVYQSTMRWIERNRLNGIICYNGRMDLTQAVTYASEQAGIPYVTHERTWFGDGLRLIPNANCLSIKALNAMVKLFDEKPLKSAQAKVAGKLAGERFLQRNRLEWRLYNKNHKSIAWPLKTKGLRVLILPSSRNEFAGHDEWKSGWKDNTQALDDFLAAFSINPEQVVVRCHPNWAENINKVSGKRSLAHYRNWTKKRGIYCISSELKDSTYDLIQQADMVVLNGGSSAVEAGVCGKQVICLGPAGYEGAGFVRVFRDRDALSAANALDPIDPETVIRKTLRYIYLRYRRFPQYVNYVRAVETTNYIYFDGADPDRLVSLLKTGTIAADDPAHATDNLGEDPVVDLLKRKQWRKLADCVVTRSDLKPFKVARRVGLRWIDTVRTKLPRGDRG
jgi:hypothetical protein